MENEIKNLKEIIEASNELTGAPQIIFQFIKFCDLKLVSKSLIKFYSSIKKNIKMLYDGIKNLRLGEKLRLGVCTLVSSTTAIWCSQQL